MSKHSTSSYLEQKLELLESRFTAPPTSPATLMPDGADSRSQHSFGFTDASTSNVTTTPTPSWVKMTEKHLRKVASEDPTIITGHTGFESAPKVVTSTKPKRLVVQESPPAKENSSPSPKPKTTTTTTTTSASSKRKPIAPVKRQQQTKSAPQPPRKRHRHAAQVTGRFNENSRDETRTKHTQRHTRSPNNSKINDFFSSKRKPKKDKIVSSTTTSPTSHHRHLTERIQLLQTELDDTKSQLQAVSNNRTILHSQLQASLHQAQQDLQSTTASVHDTQRRYQTALVHHVRQAAVQTAHRRREALAAAAQRLGRFVKDASSSWRQHPVWEDGAELVELRKRLAEWEERHTMVLEQQQQQTTSTTTPTVESVTASAATAYQLRRCAQERDSLRHKLSQLRKEQIAHQKAVSLSASEDSSVFRDRPALDDHRYVLCSMLGKGGFSEVWKAFDVVDLEYVAVKIHALDARWSDAKKDSYTKHVSREYEIQRQVRHAGIVSLKAVFEIDSNSFATVLSLCDGIDLDVLLKTKGRLSQEDARAILLQTLSAMLYLATPDESNGRPAIIHYDLKPGNILLNEHGKVFITDFGLSKIMAEDNDATSMELTSQGAGTYWYLPPECFTSNARISNKVDVWSIGVIYFQMLYGKRPFGDGQSQERILANGTMLNARSVSFPDSPVVDEGCKEFIRACLTYDQSFRPTIAELCQHPYVIGQSTVAASKKTEN